MVINQRSLPNTDFKYNNLLWGCVHIWIGVIIDLQTNTEVIGCQPAGFLSMKCHFQMFFLFLPEMFFDAIIEK